MGIVDEPIEDGVGIGRILEYFRMLLISTIWYPRSRSARAVMHYLDARFRLCSVNGGSATSS